MEFPVYFKEKEQISAAASSPQKKEVRMVEDFLNINQINEKIIKQDQYLNICMESLHRNLGALKKLPFNGTNTDKKLRLLKTFTYMHIHICTEI